MREPARGVIFKVAPTYEALSRHAAGIICGELERKRDLLLCLSAGGTPTRTYHLLAAHYARDPRLFSKLRVLQIDEWAGLPPGHPATCAEDLRRKVLMPLGIGPDRTVTFRTEAPDRQAECARVSRWLAEHGPIDVCILGLGQNGHVAMNEPADALIPRAHVAKLAASSRRHPLLGGLARKPTHGLTVGMGDILSSTRILLLVSGRSKQLAMRRLVQERVTTRFPASLLWLHPDATVLCDRESTAGARTN